MKQQVIEGIRKLALQTNEHGQYTQNTILLLQKGIRCVLVSQFNPSDPGKGMEKLLEDGTNLLTNVKLTNAITANSVLKAARPERMPPQRHRRQQSHPPSPHNWRHRRKLTV
jgi:hypothetical protein